MERDTVDAQGRDCSGLPLLSTSRSSSPSLEEAARIYREALRDKSYQLLPLGMEAARYLRYKRGVLAKSSFDAYETTLDKLARFYPDMELADFEPPVGT